LISDAKGCIVNKIKILLLLSVLLLAVIKIDFFNILAHGKSEPVIKVITKPQVLYTDIVSGPNSGGENNKGAYLSVFGKNFGSTGLGTTVKVYINDVEVDNYRYLGASKGRPDIQQITVQVGALKNPKPGDLLAIKVIVNGLASNTDRTFTVQPGDILFVDNVRGNDATAVKNNVNKPWKHVQLHGNRARSGALGSMQPGDMMVLRGRGTVWTDLGFDDGTAYFLKFRSVSGSKPTGIKGSGYIAVIGYPTEDVYIQPIAPNAFGVISGVNRDTYPNDSAWIVIADLRVEGGEHDGPINLQMSSDHWRVVNNDISAPNAPDSSRSGGISGGGTYAVVYGNNIHAISGNGQENHGIYMDNGHDMDIAYNFVGPVTGGNGIQLYNTTGNQTYNISIHHNTFHDVAKHGINIGDDTSSGIVIYNNIVYNTKYGGLRNNSTGLHGMKVYNNTFYNTVTSKNELYGVITNDARMPVDALDMRNNIMYPSRGTRYLSGTVGVWPGHGAFVNNLWYRGKGSVVGIDAAPVSGNPEFVDADKADFHLENGSSAINAGSSAVAGIVTDDYDSITSRPQGGRFDIGAFEAISP
jgi:hypothetical protein